MVALGRRGRRDGGGFQDHPADAPKRLGSGLAGLYPRRADPPSRADIERPTDQLMIQRHLVTPF